MKNTFKMVVFTLAALQLSAAFAQPKPSRKNGNDHGADEQKTLITCRDTSGLAEGSLSLEIIALGVTGATQAVLSQEGPVGPQEIGSAFVEKNPKSDIRSVQFDGKLNADDFSLEINFATVGYPAPPNAHLSMKLDGLDDIENMPMHCTKVSE